MLEWEAAAAVEWVGARVLAMWVGIGSFTSLAALSSAAVSAAGEDAPVPFHKVPWPLSRSVADWRWSAPGTADEEEEMKKMTIRATKAKTM